MGPLLLALLAVDFDREVAPLLQQRCTACHGAAVQSGGVRLDSRDAARRIGSRAVEMVASKRMPPAGGPLKDDQVDLLRRWASEDRAPHWAFQRVVKPQTRPARLAPAAWRPSLTRRLSLDLTGLPPEPSESRQGAALVDGLLASPRFGEKWARHWLDLARYADSDGYEQDQWRPHAWRYRDWVIRSFNANLPFDRFTEAQIAGDLLPGATLEQKAGTGFHRNTLTSREGGIDIEELRTGQVADRAVTVGTVWLGLTLECSRCHDHKYDPITRRDFYSFYAFFNSADEVNLADPVADEVDRYRARRPEYERKYADLLAAYKVAEFQPRWEIEVRRAMAAPAERLEWTQVLDYLAVFQDHGHQILMTPPEKRSFRQSHDLSRVFLKYPGPLASWPEAKGIRFGEGWQKLEDLDAAYPALSEIPTIQQRATPRETHVFQRGDFRSPGERVTPATPAFLPGSASNRLELARWLTSRDNPLTARVFVNRVWQELCGVGLVSTSEDFGLKGAAPEDQATLDWLAADFMETGWDVKRLIRTIALSEAYAASPRFRLSAEAIRDSALFVAGLLDDRVGGRSVKPPMPKGVIEVSYRNRAWEESQGNDRYRRGLYTFFWRSIPHPQLTNFDAPSSLAACSRRGRSVTPLQSLNLLNDPAFWEAAQSLGRRMAARGDDGIAHGFRLCFHRDPEPEERERLSAYWRERSQAKGEGFAWTAAASVLLNLDEFITRE